MKDTNLGRLINRRWILINGDITEDVASEVRDLIHEFTLQDSPPIKVAVSSTGGVQRFGLDIYDLLCSYDGEKTGVVLNYALSCAVLPLLACNHRVALPHSRILFHYGTLPMGVNAEMLRNPNWVKRAIDSLEEGDKILRKIIFDRTNLSEEDVDNLLSNDRALVSDEALELGLIDGISTHPLKDSEISDLKIGATV